MIYDLVLIWSNTFKEFFNPFRVRCDFDHKSLLIKIPNSGNSLYIP